MNRFEPQRFWVRGARRVDAFWTTRTSGFTNENRVRTRFSICEGCHHVPGLLRHPCTRSTSSPMYPVYFVTHVPGLLRHPCTRSAPLRVVEIASCSAQSDPPNSSSSSVSYRLDARSEVLAILEILAILAGSRTRSNAVHRRRTGLSARTRSGSRVRRASRLRCNSWPRRRRVRRVRGGFAR